MALDGSNVLVAWALSSAGTYTGSCVRSADLGATWQGLSAPLFALWSDYTYAGFPVALSFDWLAGPRPLGGAASGGGGLTPELAMERGRPRARLP